MKRDAGEVEDMDDDDEDLVHPCARCIIIFLSYFTFDYYYYGGRPVGTPGAWMHIHYHQHNNNNANSNVIFYYNLCHY
jgi:hypothetical protein